MDKHEGEQGRNRLPAAEVSDPSRIGVAGGDQGITDHQGIGFPAKRKLYPVKKHVKQDKDDIDERKMAGLNRIAKRNHEEITSAPLNGPLHGISRVNNSGAC